MVLSLSGAAAGVWCVAIVCATIIVLALTLRWWFDDGKGPNQPG
jgi:hypothetical protein